MKTIKPWHLFEQDKGEQDKDTEPKPAATKVDIDPLSVVTMGSLISKSATADPEMKTGNQYFHDGQYYDAFKQYKTAQQKDPNYFWAYYNAASAAFNQGSTKAIRLIPKELIKAQHALKNWQGDEQTRKHAKRTFDAFILNVRKHTDLNI